MVYRGPSPGCRTCRKRHVKTPHCGNCLRYKQACPGYQDAFDNRHRVETISVSGKSYKQTVCVRKPSGVSTTTNHPEPQRPISKYSSLPRPSQLMENFKTVLLPTTYETTSVIQPMMSQGLESAAIGFFFGSYIVNRDDEASCSFLKFLPFMFGRSTPQCPLYSATRALAIYIAQLWDPRMTDSAISSGQYALAVEQTRKAISDPRLSRSDDLLMATLVLEFYDSLNLAFKGEGVPGLHSSGSVALMKHRDLAHLQSEVSRKIAAAVRSRLVYLAVERNRSDGCLDDDWIDVGRMPQTLAMEVDGLAIDLVRLQDLTQLIDGPVEQHDHERRRDRLALLHQAIELKVKCKRWVERIPKAWHPVSLHVNNIEESIRRISLYNETCDVYSNLTVSNLLNWHRTIELGVLRIICKYGSATKPGNDDPCSCLEDKDTAYVQNIVDQICASVAFHTGDVVQPIKFHSLDSIVFPQAHIPSPTGFAHCSFPKSMENHAHEAVHSGMWMIYSSLLRVLRLLRDTDKWSCRPIVREGQLEWIQNQILRLRNVFGLHLRQHV